jgi:exodeoxyribonuclease-3
LRVATWNINSIRLRSNLIARLIGENQPDVICLQETKCPPGQFPTSEFKSLGYGHIAENGFSGHHGVAIISRLPFDEMDIHQFCGKADGRHVSVHFSQQKLTVHSLYIPAGGDEPDPVINDKFSHKLEFLDEMKSWANCHLSNPGQSHIFTGDFNVAPLESDVWSHKQLLKVVSHTPFETSRLVDIQKSCDLHDPIRAQIPEPEKLYSWWSYRSRDWEASDRGRRLDHIWVSKELVGRCSNAQILKHVRGWERPSDHAPVLIDIA